MDFGLRTTVLSIEDCRFRIVELNDLELDEKKPEDNNQVGIKQLLKLG